MRIDYSLVTRRTFLNTLLGGWIFAFLSGSVFALFKFASPTLGKEPDFVILKISDYTSISPNSVKAFAWGGKLGLFLKNENGEFSALKGVCTHMECNITSRPEEKKFYCACHKGWFDQSGKNIEGPPPKPLERFDISTEGDKMIVSRKGFKVELLKA